jgi:chromosomal replication initiator protein
MELTAAELWTRIQETVRDSIPQQAYRTWLSGTSAVGLSANELIVDAPSRFHVEWIEDKYGALLSATAYKVLGRPLSIVVTCTGDQQPIPMPSLDQLAVAASRAVAGSPAKMYNPLFLYGGVGLGKTHLMHAIGHKLLADDPGRRVAYVSSEQFTNELVGSIQKGTMADFRRRYREMDLLLVDDIHFLEGKEGTQEEFFHTFNALYDAQRQIILTSDRPPKEIPRLENRLVSRFEWGLVVDIRAPDYETRIAILRKKAADDGLMLDDEVIDYIAHSCTNSVRELEGAVIKLLAYSSLTRQEITPSLAKTALRGVLGRKREGPILAPERIQDMVARRWRVRPEALASKRRTKDLTVPRHVAMYLIKETLGTSLVRIGQLFGGRDHSTVIHSIRKVEEEMARDPEFRKLVLEARDEVRDASSRK